jgi:hypothetical protein
MKVLVQVADDSMICHCQHPFGFRVVEDLGEIAIILDVDRAVRMLLRLDRRHGSPRPHMLFIESVAATRRLGVDRSLTAYSQEELAISEIRQKYSKRWVAAVVTQRDRNLQPVRGQVVADDVDRYRLRQKITRFNDICIFYAGETEFPLLL